MKERPFLGKFCDSRLHLFYHLCDIWWTSIYCKCWTCARCVCTFDVVWVRIPYCSIKRFDFVLHFGILLCRLFFLRFSVTPLMYAASYLFNIPSVAFLSMACFNVFIGMITTITTATLEQLGAERPVRNLTQLNFQFFTYINICFCHLFILMCIFRILKL